MSIHAGTCTVARIALFGFRHLRQSLISIQKERKRDSQSTQLCNRIVVLFVVSINTTASLIPNYLR